MPRGSEPGFRRPILVVQSDAFNRSRLQTVLAVVLTSNVKLVAKPGNVLLPQGTTGLPKDTVVNVTQIATVGEEFLDRQVGVIPRRVMAQVEDGLRLVLDL